MPAEKTSPDVARVRLDLPLDYGQRFDDIAWTLRTSKAALARQLVMDFIDSQLPVNGSLVAPVPAPVEKKTRSGKK